MDIHRLDGFLLDPVNIFDLTLGSEEISFKSHRQKVLPGVQTDHIVGFGSRAVDSPPLANGKKVQSFVLTQYVAIDIFNQAGFRFKPLMPGKEISIVFAFDKAHILAFAGFNRLKSLHVCQLNNVGFFHISERKSGAGQMLLGQPGQKVGLVLFGINAFKEMKLAMTVFLYSGIVSGCQL